ncbi:hypothetical protein AB4Z21_37485, partial [Paenibacillus sp. MCAF20]
MSTTDWLDWRRAKMSTTDWLKPLQHILNCPIHVHTISVTEWVEVVKDADALWPVELNAHHPMEGQRVEKHNKLHFVAALSDHSVELLEIEFTGISQAEKELISWTLQLVRGGEADSKKALSVSESERNALKLSEWIQQQLEEAEPAYS